MISFYDADEGELYVATFTPADRFDVEIVAEPESPGCLGITATGLPAVAYADDENNGKVNYAVLENGTWTTADTGGVGASEVSLAFGPDGEPALAYYDFDANMIRFAARSAGAWSVVEVEAFEPNLDFMPGSASLAFTASGAPAIAYLDPVAERIRYAVRQGGGLAWTITTIDDEVAPSFSAIDGRPSLAFASSGEPAVAYFDFDTREVRYATRCEGTWVSATVDTIDGPNFQLGRVNLIFIARNRPTLSYSSGRPLGINTVGSDPGAKIQEVRRTGDSLSIRFTGPPGVSDWAFSGSPDLQIFSDELTPVSAVSESVSEAGSYAAEFALAEGIDRYFVRVE